MSRRPPETLPVLHSFEASGFAPALRETVRLLESDKFEQLSSADIREIANYRAVELGEEVFFEEPFTPGKEAAAALFVAHRLGREAVLRDLRSLGATLGPAAAADHS